MTQEEADENLSQALASLTKACQLMVNAIVQRFLPAMCQIAIEIEPAVEAAVALYQHHEQVTESEITTDDVRLLLGDSGHWPQAKFTSEGGFSLN